MDFRRLTRLLILSALICYFVNTVVESVIKLQEAKIGTLFRKITEDTVEGGGVNVIVSCCFRELAIVYPFLYRKPQHTYFSAFPTTIDNK